mgnify:CR=1 FL=1
MHYHDLDNQEWRGINMRLSYPHKDITLEDCCLRHRWCGLGFGHDDCVNIFLGILVILIHGGMGR